MEPCQGRSVSRWGWTSLFTWSTVCGVVKFVMITAPSSMMACLRAGMSAASMRWRVGVVADGIFDTGEVSRINDFGFGVKILLSDLFLSGVRD